MYSYHTQHHTIVLLNLLALLVLLTPICIALVPLLRQRIGIPTDRHTADSSLEDL